MRSFLPASLAIALATTLGCSSSTSGASVAEEGTGEHEIHTVVEGQPFDKKSLVGQQVTLIGVQTRTKIPSVCGVDVDGDDALADVKVQVTGTLRRHEVAPRGPDEPIVASRGPGVYYSLERADGQGLAVPTRHE